MSFGKYQCGGGGKQSNNGELFMYKWYWQPIISLYKMKSLFHVGIEMLFLCLCAPRTLPRDMTDGSHLNGAEWLEFGIYIDL